MSEKKSEDFGEFSGLAERLRRTDFTGESRVKDELKERLLAKAEKSSRRRFYIWLVPVTALAAALIMLNVRHKLMPGPARAASYSLPSDGYAECGRQGLADYREEGRF